jgi:hypothetical protein
MNRPHSIAAARLLCCAALIITAAGCTAKPAANDTPSGSASGDAVAVWREFVTCARENGEQNMPDPVVDNEGAASFPVAEGFEQKRAFETVRNACGAILNRLPADVNPLANEPKTEEQLEVLRRYVQCIRDNGIQDMPDPGPNGEIVDPPGAGPDGPRRQVRDAARNVCDRILLEEYK